MKWFDLVLLAYHAVKEQSNSYLQNKTKGASSAFFITGTSEKLELCLSSIRETCNIVEMVRSGIIGLSRSEKTVK
ncbi:hypothetical protein B6D08_10815 [Gilliamella apicola]|uniref:Acetolactate synthase small subunit C-terminal domain-containing protein n=1 Tax=Gilliamella apicola TaxID=1196095 RepID=A0A242NFI5_9GAMM|nr:hypothetical protein B5S40_13245 [Gilliamella apicola]OTP86003.1 hypothetical protein B5S44_02840 [Gilliamella apicola]OTP88393.1 hypothetical protein B5S42_07890 [Gilliamella apicola]OTP98548.1 hypothetical protein B6D08_10815 [Gilliamella apicola]OTQ08850.1 hypothetical protein B6C87_10840 [Gilliamella apicola]